MVFMCLLFFPPEWPWDSPTVSDNVRRTAETDEHQDAHWSNYQRLDVLTGKLKNKNKLSTSTSSTTVTIMFNLDFLIMTVCHS